ncbi:glycosyltransferase family 4 protein [Rubrivirga sp. IMCC45206]|uniref:glycosyltransferase family 4 protein n=1 Tax=Rubrivirga sp. IMCC45206 TaxID=3391614 RepID=UPI00398FC12B
MPRLLFVNQHYWPDIASTGQHLTDLAEHCAARGFDVDVLCAHARYLAGELEAPAEEVHNGVRIRRLRTTAFGRGSHLGRLADYGGFYLGVLRRLLTGPAYDLVVVLTTPPLLSYAASLMRRLRKRPYAIWSMDLHPDAEVGLGMLAAGGLPARRLEAFNRTGYRTADLVIDLGFRMKERIEAKGVEADRLQTIAVWSDGEEVFPVDPADNAVRRELGLDPDRFVVMYSGNAGLAHRFDEVLEAMCRLRDDPRFFFLFVGGGPRKAEVEAYIAEHGISNAVYRGYFPREHLAQSLSAGDVHLLTLREAMAGIAVPGKLYGVMAAGRPIVMVGPERSEPAQTIRDHDIGEVVDPHAPDAVERLVSILQALADEPGQRHATGAHARTVFEAHYDRPILCEAWAQTLADHLDHDLPAPTPIAVPA